MKSVWLLAAAIATSGLQAGVASAGGWARLQAHGVPMVQPQAHQRVQLMQVARPPVQHGARTAKGQAHLVYGGPRLEQRPDPNHQNPYRPMFSLNATNPGESHPYFRTRKEGFGYPPARSAPVYLGNGLYVIQR